MPNICVNHSDKTSGWFGLGISIDGVTFRYPIPFNHLPDSIKLRSWNATPAYLWISKGVGKLPPLCFWPDTTNCRVSYMLNHFIKPDRTIRSVSLSSSWCDYASVITLYTNSFRHFFPKIRSSYKPDCWIANVVLSSHFSERCQQRQFYNNQKAVNQIRKRQGVCKKIW